MIYRIEPLSLDDRYDLPQPYLLGWSASKAEFERPFVLHDPFGQDLEIAMVDHYFQSAVIAVVCVRVKLQ